MKKVWLGIGVVIIIILLLLQTRFSTYFKLNTSGYAIEVSTVKQLLLSDPEEEIQQAEVPYYSFSALDYIYKRGDSYYMGENRKTEVDIDFPVLINGGAGVQFTDHSSTLFDVNYEEYETYQGLMVSEKISYNPGGERADANEFLFCRLRNGLFVNLDKFMYWDRETLREVTMNSTINFKEGFFTYCEPDHGRAVLQICRDMKDSDLVIVNGEEITYHELLLRLHIIKDKVAKAEPEATPTPEFPEPIENEIGEREDANEEADAVPVEEAETKQEEETETDKNQDTEEENKDKNKEKPSAPRSGQNPRTGSQNGSSSARNNKRTDASKPQTGKGSMGVRPDSARPDKQSKKEEKPIEDYVKPTVVMNSVTAGVYRVMMDVTVTDPADRISPLRKVQFEIYEQLSGGSEQLVYRTYTGSSKTVEAGNGLIKPDTVYRVNAFFTYNDEYGRTVVESIPVENEGSITTMPFSSVGSIILKKGLDSNQVDYQSIPYYYDNMLSILNMAYDETSSEEAVYGIDTQGGITLRVTGPVNISSNIEASKIALFKKGQLADFASAPALEANGYYNYSITMKDYFDNEITVEQNTGEFNTCKARPKGNMEVTNNEIGSLRMKIDVTDLDASAIKAQLPENTDNYDIYYVVSSVKNTDRTPLTWEDCKAYIDNGYQRVPADEEADTPEGIVHFLYRFEESEYLRDGKIDIHKTIEADVLDLNTKYYAYLFCDYDLNNNRGPVWFGQIAEKDFRSATLSSLGNIFVDVDISNVTAHEAVIMYSLNEKRTNDVLEELLSTVKFDINTAGGAELSTDSSITFDSDAMKTFTGWYMNGTERVHDASILGKVVMDAAYFNGEKGGPLKSMMEYEIVPDIWATYNGKEYQMNTVLSKSNFKTMREPAKVLLDNILFAAGALRFDVKVEDPDDSITGNSGHMVVMNLYDYNHNFVKAIRIPKNTDAYIHQEITGLDANKNYTMTFIAVEYNEGYSNATFESNKVIFTQDITSAIDISGSVKLKNISYSQDAGSMLAHTTVKIFDPDHVMNETMPYYIKVERDGTDVTESYDASVTTISQYTYGSTAETKNTITNSILSPDGLTYPVDKGKHTYCMTLYIRINNNDLVLDTLTFSSQDMVESISTPEEFIEKIKANNGNGKYCVTADINLESPAYEFTLSDGTVATPTNIVSIFNGQLDFQGFTLSFNKDANSGALFTNIGPKGEIANAVFDIKMENPSRCYDTGVLTRINYGNIHDVYVNYLGGSAMPNAYFGILTRINAITGVIERFVVNNAPENGLMPFSARSSAGLICESNQGIIRNGYVYGDDIYSAMGDTSVGGNLNIAAIAGAQSYRGQTTNVFSLVNVQVASPGMHSMGNANKQYGSVIGSAYGRLQNMYGIGQSFYSQSYNNAMYDSEVCGPVLGLNSKASNVFYWNENNADYENATYQQRIGLESLYDYSWQQAILGDQFDTQPVEVGYYPHIIMNTELPEQPYLELPRRSNANLVEVMSTSVLSYAEDGNSALIEFRLSNTRNAEISGITIENLTTVIEEGSAESADGFTTLRATVSNPQKFCSSYDITKISCSLSGRTQNVTFNPNPVLMADFYRPIYTTDDWYDYVVKSPTENARLMNDLDFSGIAAGRIRVTANYTGKLNSRIKEGTSYGYSLMNIDFSNEYSANVFYRMYGEVKNICIDQITLSSSAAPRNQGYNGFVAFCYSKLENIHIRHVSMSGYAYIGALAAVCYSGSDVQDCSASDVTITYKEPNNTNSNAYIGGLVGSGENTRISNSYVRNIQLIAEDLKNCEGAGGVIGRSNYCALDSVYATGDISVRGMNVGGIVGRHIADNTTNSLQNMISRVNVKSYQDSVGGLIGENNLGSTLTERNNMSGVAFGNVFCSNTDAENVSYTTGSLSGYRGTFYGSDFQLFNGMTGVSLTDAGDDNTYGLITYDQAIEVATYTDGNLLGMDEVYNYSKVTEGFLPTLYYADGSRELPFQEENLPISLLKVQNNLISVTSIGVNELAQYIWMDLKGPAGCEITNVDIKDLACIPITEQSTQVRTFGADGSIRLWVYYKDLDEQTRFKDSYELMQISYKNANTTPVTVGASDFSLNPVRVPLTLYGIIMQIDGEQSWNQYINAENNFGNYDNYKVVANLGFGSGVVYSTNAKIGRLVGETQSGRATLSGVTLTKDNENLIFRLNSELRNIDFVNCSVSSAGRDCVGLIGTSAAIIRDVSFENITIDNRKAQRNFAGIIAYQMGGAIGFYDEENPDVGKVTLKNVSIGLSNYCQQYVGGLVGYAKNNTLFTNIEAQSVVVKGSHYVGGLVGGTAKASFDRINCADFMVSSKGNGRTGGIVGAFQPGYTSVNSAYFNNVHLTGTPVRDENGHIISSTTTIAVEEGNAQTTAIYVGGLMGYSNVYCNGFSGTAVGNKNPNSATGIVVKGFGSYVGGISGYSYIIANAKLEDSLVTLTKNPNELCNYAGGISGYNNYTNYYNVCQNSEVNVTNFSDVGLIIGRQASSSMYYATVENSALYAGNTLSNKVSKNYGGICGYNAAPTFYSTVMNTTIDASDANMENIGGVVGYSNNNVDRCFYYAQPASENQPTAMDTYYVKGNNITGGIIGYQASGGLLRSYSNANVESVNNYAGGLSGAYKNTYIATTISGKKTYAYSYVTMQHNYFAGSVKASDYAGGAIGRLEMVYEASVADEHKESGGRSKTATAVGYKSGANNESAYTYGNLILASAVDTTEGTNAYAYCGNRDGFEGKANISTAKADATALDKASRTFFWEGMSINGTLLCKMTRDSAPAMAKNLMNNTGNRFVKWKPSNGEYDSLYGIAENNAASSVNVRTMSTQDLKSSTVYRAAHWFKWSYSSVAVNDMRGDYFRLFTDESAGDTASYNSMGDSAYYKGKNYLPHVRVNGTSNSISDILTRYQSAKQIALPIPQYDAQTDTFLRSASAFRGSANNYGIVYTSDIDKVNVEFGRELVDNGYFVLFYGDAIIDSGVITKRAYTYNYDFKKNVKLIYGYADVAGFVGKLEAEGRILDTDFSLKDIVGTEYCIPITDEPLTYKIASFQHHVMTHGSKYYYISEDGLVSGTGSSVSNEYDEDESRNSDRTVEDASATTLAGNYVSLYHGKALTSDGTIIDAENGSTLGSLQEGMTVLEVAKPMLEFVLNGFTVETYAKFTEILGTDIVVREQQVLKSMNGDIAMIDGTLSNIKDSVVMYQKGDSPYCTILGEDGIMIDMYQGEDLGAPEDFKSSGIVYMTNNFECSAPFIVVEYANGGIVGYNYLTGEYLFNHYISNEMSLLDFAKVYFDGDKSELADVSRTFAANSNVAELAGSSERLYEMVTGNNSGLKVEDNSTGEGTKADEDSIKAVAEDGVKTGEDTALRDIDTDGIKPEYTGDLADTEADTTAMEEKIKSTNQGDVDDTQTESGISDGTLSAQGITDGELSTGSSAQIPEGAMTQEAYSLASGVEGTGLGVGSTPAAPVGQGEVIEGTEGTTNSGSLAGAASTDGASTLTDAEGTGETNVSAAIDTPGDEAGLTKTSGSDEKIDLSLEEDQLPSTSSNEKADADIDADSNHDEGIVEESTGDVDGDSQKEKSTDVTPNGTKSMVSTAGTVVTQTETDGITKGTKPAYGEFEEDKDNDQEQEDDRKDVVETNKNLVTVYNQSSGTYEIVDLNTYLDTASYQSENVKLAVKDLTIYAGYAQKQEKKKTNGLGFYILISLAVLGGVSLTIRYRRKHR